MALRPVFSLYPGQELLWPRLRAILIYGNKQIFGLHFCFSVTDKQVEALATVTEGQGDEWFIYLPGSKDPLGNGPGPCRLMALEVWNRTCGHQFFPPQSAGSSALLTLPSPTPRSPVSPVKSWGGGRSPYTERKCVPGFSWNPARTDRSCVHRILVFPLRLQPQFEGL